VSVGEGDIGILHAGLDRRALILRAMALLGSAAIPLAACGETHGEDLPQGQLELIAAYAETLIPETDTPGAIGVGVPRTVEHMLRSWASAKTRAEFAAVLASLDTAARKDFGTGLAALPPARRESVVAAFDAARLAALDSPYIRLKELVLVAYYLSEPGATEELRYELIPGVWEASMPLGEDRRAWAV
jgi:hypothetical protein